MSNLEPTTRNAPDTGTVAEAPANHNHPRMRRAIGKAAVGLVAGAALGGLAGAAYGSFSPTHIELGPHEATAQATLDSHITFDLGPLGSATRKSTLPSGAGFNVAVKGIAVPPDQSALASAASVANQYKLLLADPEHIESQAKHTVVKRVEHTAQNGAGIVGTLGLGIAVLGETRRRRKDNHLATALELLDASTLPDANKEQLATEMRAGVHPEHRTWRKLALGMAMASTLVACTSDVQHTAEGPNPAIDHALDDTPFQGFALNGELLRLVVDEAVPKVQDYINSNGNFYNAVATNFGKAFNEKFDDTPPDHNSYLFVANVSDNHCNIGMDRVHAAVAHAFRADLMADTGDTTMGGTGAESECVSAFADSMHDVHVPIVAIRGNHDSSTTEQQEHQDGETVIGNNKMIKSVGGLTIMGVGDARETRFGEGTKLYDQHYTIADEGADLAKAAAAAHPDLILVHDPDAAVPAITDGSAYLSISGDTHHLSGPNLLNTKTYSYQFTEGTSGGAKPGALTVGPLQQPAIETVFALDKVTHRPVGYYLVTSNPDKSVSISDFTYMPTQPANLKPVTPGANHD